MVRKSKTKKEQVIIHKSSAAKLDSRETRRSQIEHERLTRTCSCPAWETHSAKCPVNFLLADDNANLNPFEVIRRRKEAKKEKEEIVKGIGKETVLTGTTTGTDQTQPPVTVPSR